MRFLFLIALLASLAFPKVLRDSPGVFSVRDSVRSADLENCALGKRVLGEKIVYRKNSAMPYRVYRVALPSSSRPSVSVKNLSVKALGKYCEEDTVVFRGAFAEKPRIRDGLWVSDVWVPLLIGKKESASLLTSFELTVSFSGESSGKNPGKRALSQVVNPNAGARFGIFSASLRKSSLAEVSSAEWLVRFFIGDREHAGFSETGLYGVSYREVRNALLSLGRAGELDGIRINDLRLYGAPSDTLPDVPSAPTFSNLSELPLETIDKNNNGIFDEGDSLYFIGYGTSLWKRMDLEDKNYAACPMEYYFSSSPYSYYQVFHLAKNSSGPKKSLSKKLSAPSSGTLVTPLRYVRAEKDLMLRDTYFGREGGVIWETASGKEWFWFWNPPNGETKLSSKDLSFKETENLPHKVSSGKSFMAVSFFPRRSTAESNVGDGVVQTVNFVISGKPYEERMKGISFDARAGGESVDFSLCAAGNFVGEASHLKSSDNTYELTIHSSGGYFDRFDGYSIAYEWAPETDSADWVLPGALSGKIKIPVPKNLSTVKFSNGIPEGILPNEKGMIFDSISSKEDVRYLIYNPKRILSPKVSGISIRNSGVLSRPEKISSKTEYLIIAPEEFQEPALRLASFRSGKETAFPLATTLVLVEDIYRLYTGGSPSPVAIRDFLSYARSVSPDLRFVLLAGSGHYDYRGRNTSLPSVKIPVFEKEDLLSEDFFSVLDSGESIRFGVYDLDLSVGRLPVRSTAEFYTYLEKAKAHEQKMQMDNGHWRNTIIYAADDAKNGNSIDMQEHTDLIESLASTIDFITSEKNFRVSSNKIYLLDYEEDASGNKPEAASDLISAINQGALFTIYFGHGNLTDWASEGLLKPAYFSQLSNEGRYTILSSFSCSLARFDKGDAISLSEQFVTEKNKGSILSIGATRESYGNYNAIFAKSFFSHALGDSAVRIGEAFLRGKGLSLLEYTSQRYNNERYALLGEPVIMMPVIGKKISFDSEIDSLQALDKMVLSGNVSGMTNGKIYLSMREGERIKKLSNLPASDDSVEVRYAGSLIYSETVDVRGGKFSTEFITPRKISFGDTAAEITAYAYAEGEGSVGRYLSPKIRIAGISSYADSIHDSYPPEIKISLCNVAKNTYLAEGEKVRLASPACLQVTVEDSTALDFSEEPDEGISFEVIGKTSPFHPWSYLEQTAKRVVTRMSFSENSYPAGLYEFKVRAQDILGNSASKKVFVEIAENLSAGLADCFNAPNPLGKKGTTFYFKDLAVGRSAKISILIYNQNGRLVQRLRNAKSGETHWDGRDFYGRRLANGLYHYVVRSEVPASGEFGKKTFEKKQKLLISR